MTIVGRCWLLELAQSAPPSWELQGFDVSAAQFPAKEYLPQNVHFTVLDAFGDVPEELLCRFDIVHIRAFAVVVKQGALDALLVHLVRLLKPGGHLQWDEKDTASFNVHAPNETVSKENADRFLTLWQEHCGRAGFNFDWISDLERVCSSYHLNPIYSIRRSTGDDLRKASTDNWLMGLEEFCTVATARVRGPLGTRNEFVELFNKVVAETANGVSIAMDMIVVVAVKAV
ncbi:MAG: hypothetical protein Q9225_006813 [Loekoesia sp. 1 TL-2023]